MDSVDRQVRGAAHGVDHEMLAAHLPAAWWSTGRPARATPTSPSGAPYLLAATNRRTATDLLWETLAAATPDVPVSVAHVTAGERVGRRRRDGVPDGAVDRGYLALRGHQAAGAVPAQRPLPLSATGRGPVKGCGVTTTDLPLLVLGRGTDLPLRAGRRLPRRPARRVRPRPGRAGPGRQGGARRPGIRARSPLPARRGDRVRRRDR